MITRIKLTALIFSLSIGVLKVNAQDSPVKVSSKVSNDKNVELAYDKSDPGTFTILVRFKELTNTDGSNEQDFTIKGYSGNLLTLKPKVPGQGIGYSFGYTSIRGKFEPKYDSDFIYALPYKAGSKVRVAEAAFVGAKYFGNTTPADWKTYNFYIKLEDTVTAIRKGVVVEIKDLYESSSDVAYTTKSNGLIIEHADGTLATYRGFKKGSFVVEVGQTVFPGTALGVNSKSHANNDFNISVMLTYLKSKEIDRSRTLQNSNSLYGFITPRFSTLEDSNVMLENRKTYTVSLPVEVQKKELTKKELKKQGISSLIRLMAL
ncbi:Peptidase family M23 [compost metagenome]